MNVLKPHLQTTIWTLLGKGATQREIARITGISRHTIRAYQQRFAAEPPNCPTPATDFGGHHGFGVRAAPRLHIEAQLRLPTPRHGADTIAAKLRRKTAILDLLG
ncbi:hypothetical protein GALL_430640 [mine drainage metagenome]|uniref:HTH merR-type domain-containing protein n=1 Tax=mine drainage metagenome TaxID=410659 RepID=A0A1J5PUH9_9ZZZZ